MAHAADSGVRVGLILLAAGTGNMARDARCSCGATDGVAREAPCCSPAVLGLFGVVPSCGGLGNAGLGLSRTVGGGVLGGLGSRCGLLSDGSGSCPASSVCGSVGCSMGVFAGSSPCGGGEVARFTGGGSGASSTEGDRIVGGPSGMGSDVDMATTSIDMAVKLRRWETNATLVVGSTEAR